MAAGRPRKFNREIALEKAMYLFWEKGYEGTTMTDIVETLGIKPPSIYAAFGNKDSLFSEVVDLYKLRIRNGSVKSLKSEPDIYKAVALALKANIDLLTDSENPSSCLIMFGAINTAPEHSNHVESLKVLRDKNKHIWVERFIKAKDEGQLKSDADPAALAEYFVTFIHGMALRSKDGSVKSELLSSCQLALAGLKSVIKNAD